MSRVKAKFLAPGGSNGQVLTFDDTQTEGHKWAAAGGGGLWEKIYDYTVSGSSIQEIDLPNILETTDYVEAMVKFYWAVDSNTSGIKISIYQNGTMQTSYFGEYINAYQGSLNATNVSGNVIGFAANQWVYMSYQNFFTWNIPLIDLGDYKIFHFWDVSKQCQSRGRFYTQSGYPIQGINFTASSAVISAGSRLIIYGLKA